jgi:hypothetical protein
MSLVKITTIAMSVLFTVSCSSEDPPPPPKKTVFDPLTHQLDRARDVQKTIDDSAAKQRAAVDSQERGDNAP